MSTNACPNRDQLRAFHLGTLSEDEAEPLIDHVSQCATCQAALETVDDANDPVFQRVRAPQVADTYAEEAECQDVVARVQHGLVSRANVAGLPPKQPERRQLGEYELLEQLGQGGMGAVYKARQTRLDKIVAVKVLLGERMKTPKAIARFEREMRAVGRLDHANIVRALHAGEDGDTPYLVVEYVDGLNLADLVARLGVLPIADACELVRQAAAVGLQHAYENGLVHRDIKPSNLMLTRDGTLKILDLGLALLQTDAPHGAEMTGAGTAMGTADYMAPEQVTDSHSVDIRSDLYSLGCTLYKLLSGRAPFVGPEYKNEMTKMMAHVQQTPRPITSLRTDVPPDLAAVVERMMAKDPGQRYATPADVAAALASFAVGANLRSLLSDALRKTEPPAPSLEPRIDTDQMAAGPVVDTATSAATPAPQLAPALPCSRTDFQSVQATTQPVPQVAAAAARGRRWNSRAVGMLTLATGFAFVVLGVIAVRIRDKIGRETVIRVPIADLCFRPVAD